MTNNRYYPELTLLVTAALAAITLFNQFFLLGTVAALATISYEIYKFIVGRLR